MKIYKNILIASIFAILINGCGGSGGGSSSSNSISFDDAKLINFSELNSYEVITDETETNMALNHSSSSNKKTQSNYQKTSKISQKAKEIMTHAILNPDQKVFNPSLSNTSNSDLIYYNTDTEQGSVSGSLKYNLTLNYTTGKVTGTMKFNNYKNRDSDSTCTNEPILKNHGTINFSASFNVNTYDYIKTTISTDSTFYIDDITIQKGYLSTTSYSYGTNFSDDETTTITALAKRGNETQGYKDYKIRSYTSNGYNYEYPLSGDIYVFSGDLNGYFSVDSSHDHSLTPLKTDYCEENAYSGVEKYVGENSTLTFTMTSTNQYLIEIDTNNDGIIDQNISATWE